MTTRSTWAYRIVIAALVAVIAVMAYVFLIAGSTHRQDDGRIAVQVTADERALVLREMRGFVEGLQALTAGLAANDMKAVAAAARTMGTAHSHDIAPGLLGKLPLEFKRLAFRVHGAFDTIALDAEAMAMPSHTLAQLAAALQGCAACHAAYALDAGTPR
jgi:hypothetical protein